MVKGADIASAGTLNLTTATGNGVHVTGTTTITAVTLGSGMWRLVVFDGALTLTHHATSNNLPSGANITTAAGDRALYWADGTTVYCAIYMPANAAPIAPYVDTNPVVKGSADATKLLRFEVDGFTTATTRVLTPPNFDGTISTLAGTEALTNKDISSATNTYRAASDTATGAIEIAIQSEMETGSSTTLAVTPGRQQYHPSAAKAWLVVDSTGSIGASYNITSVTDSGTGQVDVSWDVDFSGAAYPILVSNRANTNLYALVDDATPPTASGARIHCRNTGTGTLTDTSRYYVAAFGDQ